MEKSSYDLLHSIALALHEKKAVHLLAIDVHKVTSMMDYVLIVQGNVGRHLEALKRSVVDTLGKAGDKVLYIEGRPESGWIVLDCFSVIVHLFLPKQRDLYRIEQLYSGGQIISLDLPL